MARGYLGKISAVISANTGDYVRKLNESAKETAAFARTVQQTLGRASSEASKSLEGIYTPIQKVERALRAAASQKLAFRGFDGAIRDVQSLQSAIAKLTDKKTIDLVVKTSGVGSLDELKRTIGVLRNQDVTIGVEGLRQQRAAIGDTGPGRIVATAAIEEAKRLDAVIEALERIDAESLKKISIQVEDAQLTAASNQFRRLTELSTQVGGPLARVQSEFSGLSGTIQAQFIPALAQAQNSYEQFQQRIKDNSDIAASEFRGLVADVKVVENAISRLRETAAAGGKLFTGEELTFVRPQAVDELNKLAAAQQKLAAAPAEVRGSSSARELLADGQVLQEQIGRISARIERLNAQGLDIKFSQAGFDLALRRLEEVRRLTEELAAGTSQGDSAEAAALARRAAAEKDFIVESQRLREQAMADMRAREEADAQRRADAEKDFIVESQRLREQAMADMRAREEADAQRRLAAESEFIAESQRLREQAIADTRAREEADAQRRLAAESEFIAESQRLREQAMADTQALDEADAQRRAEAASRFLRVDQQGSDIASNKGRSTPLTGNRDPRTRVLGQLGQEVGDLRNRLRGVGETLAGDLGPTVDNLTTRFQNMARQGIRVSADEARRLAQEVAEINASLNSRQSIAQRFESSFGGAGRAGLSLGVDERSLRGIGAQIEFVQGRLSTLRQEVRGPVIAALDAFRVRSQQLFEGGAINTDAGRRQLRLLQDELARTLSAAGGGSVRRINEQLRRVGDIARGSFGNVGLAIQQAIFAFDDFFSVTGGLDQRIRAAGNNISQLGFILGGTAGLIGGVLVSALAQAAAGLVKWANSGAGSVEIAKALNERLERQKSLLGEITSGFNELADGVGENAFSEASRRAADFESRLTSVIDKLKEFRDSATTALNADVFMAEGVVESRQGRLREAGSLPLAAARQALLRDAERAAEQARDRARSAPAMTRRELQDAVGGGYTAPAGATNEMLRGTLEERQSELARVVDSWFYTFITPFEQANARRQIVVVSRARDSLVAAIASNIEQITRGVVAPAARRFDATANRAGEMLGRANEVGGPSGDVTAARGALEGDTRAFRDALTRLGKAAAAGRETEVRSLAKFLEALSLSVVAREREARALLAAANASARFVEVLGRLREANDTIFGDISNVASQARRDALQAAGSADSGLSRRSDADFAQARSDRLQQELRAAEDRRTAAEAAMRDAERRFRFESPDPAIRQLVNESASLRSVIESPQTAPQAAASARQRELFVNDQLNRAFASSAMGRALQDQVDEAARAAGSALARDSMITQGRELSMTPGERSARELEDNLRRINAFFDDEVQRLGFPFQGREEIEQRREEARRRLIADQMRNTAPGLFGLADSVANAVLQGPSRAALQATDVSTVEGSRELTRLLRGDDAARDQANLVELQKEANRLLDIIANAPAPVAN